ncbi:hypothetical protein WJX81_003492 [Elliptochloris bilobata]|uniref:Uncharacterized protein n=1 Tax=Elliptochloris bilobata TaxID=381761 RepID=A0AAW1RRP6_9CHLO
MSSSGGDASKAATDLNMVAAFAVRALAADSMRVPAGARFQDYLLISFHDSGTHAGPGQPATPLKLFSRLLRQTAQEDGSADTFAELVNSLVNPASLASLDPSMFQASLTGVGSEAHLINVVPCVVSNNLHGASFENNLISILPTLIKAEPSGKG